MIRFFYKTSGDTAPTGLDFFIREDGSVWRDNFRTCESQCSVVGFDDFIMECPDIGWEVLK